MVFPSHPGNAAELAKKLGVRLFVKRSRQCSSSSSILRHVHSQTYCGRGVDMAPGGTPPGDGLGCPFPASSRVCKFRKI